MTSFSKPSAKDEGSDDASRSAHWVFRCRGSVGGGKVALSLNKLREGIPQKRASPTGVLFLRGEGVRGGKKHLYFQAPESSDLRRGEDVVFLPYRKSWAAEDDDAP